MRTSLPEILGAVLTSVSELIWPRTCHICGKVLPAHADFLCSACLDGLPRLPLCPQDPGEAWVSPLAERLAGYGNPVRAISWIEYSRHAPSARLVHDIKYRGCSRLARHLGRVMALDLLPTGFFNGIDVLVPVPLHPSHQLRRGYNQSEMLACGISRAVGVPVTNPLRARRHRSQTSLSYGQRRKNVQGVYRHRQGHPLFTPGLTGWRHVLLIDDVCTTGATLGQAIDALTQGRGDLRVSVLTLALTRQQRG